MVADTVYQNPSPGKKEQGKTGLNARKGPEIQARALMKPSIDAGFYGKTTPEKNRAGLGENRPVTGQDKMARGPAGLTLKEIL